MRSPPRNYGIMGEYTVSPGLYIYVAVTLLYHIAEFGTQ